MTRAPRQLITYPLAEARPFPSEKQPASHQQQALTRLARWSRQDAPEKGGLLVIPTGGGKTFIAVRHLTTQALSAGHKVLWLAHTHHLLDQAFSAFGRSGPSGGYEVGHVRGPREQLTLRTVSGTPGHGRVGDVQRGDDVLIITVQTLARALADGRLAGLSAFLKAARSSGLTVVFDEAHHAPATTYRRLIETLRRAVPDLHLLGLTATPTHGDERRAGWLSRLFPQGVLYQVSAQELMAQGILARPHVEEPVDTLVTPDFDPASERAWAGSFRDLPERVIEQLARHQARNALIADHYLRHRERFGPTIIFADRWYQCTALVELLRARGVRAEAVFSFQEAQPDPQARRVRREDQNEAALQAFKRGELDVLVNVRMLTEGTDVPGAQTVFLTRQTTSRILLTQMVGRALRGPKFGGTPEAYIVSFIDQWKEAIEWASWADLLPGRVDGADARPRPRLPLELVDIDLVGSLARALDLTGAAEVPFLTLLPVGWFALSFDAAVDGEADEVETVRRLVPVYDQDEASYRALFTAHDPSDLGAFADLSLPGEAHAQRQTLQARFFQQAERLTPLDRDLLGVLRHAAQNGAWPDLTPFEARDAHDLDALARQLALERDLGPRALDQAVRAAYQDPALLWRTFYPSYALFKEQFDALVNAQLRAQQGEDIPELGQRGEVLPELLSPELRRQVLRRDGR